MQNKNPKTQKVSQKKIPRYRDLIVIRKWTKMKAVNTLIAKQRGLIQAHTQRTLNNLTLSSQSLTPF